MSELKLEKKYSHFTNFGVSIQPGPGVADGAGYIAYRDGFQSIPADQWTAGERWIDEHEQRIEAWRKNG